ncbi:MAG: hypothetical protein WCJ19_02605 [bacterium]
MEKWKNGKMEKWIPAFAGMTKWGSENQESQQGSKIAGMTKWGSKKTEMDKWIIRRNDD